MPSSRQFSVHSLQLMQKASVGTQSIASAPKTKTTSPFFRDMSDSPKIGRADSHG
jgi:hypothetical protein